MVILVACLNTIVTNWELVGGEDKHSWQSNVLLLLHICIDQQVVCFMWVKPFPISQKASIIGAEGFDDEKNGVDGKSRSKGSFFYILPITP
jgi:hypothetical protein